MWFDECLPISLWELSKNPLRNNQQTGGEREVLGIETYQYIQLFSVRYGERDKSERDGQSYLLLTEERREIQIIIEL